MHTVSTSLMRSGHRKRTLIETEEKNGREVILLCAPGTATRWASQYDECVRTNTIMGDLSETIDVLELNGKWTRIKGWANQDEDEEEEDDDDE